MIFDICEEFYIQEINRMKLCPCQMCDKKIKELEKKLEEFKNGI